MKDLKTINLKFTQEEFDVLWDVLTDANHCFKKEIKTNKTAGSYTIAVLRTNKDFIKKMKLKMSNAETGYEAYMSK